MFRKIFSSLFLRGLILLSRFILMIIMTKYLLVKDVGEYGILMAMILLVMPFCGLNYLSYSRRLLLKSDESEWPRILRDHFAFHLVTLVIVLPLSLLIFFWGYLEWHFLIWFYFLLLGDYLCDEAYKILVTLKQATKANIIQFIRYGFWVYLLAVLFLFNKSARTLESLYLFRGLSSLIGIGMTVWYLRHLKWKGVFRYKFDWSVYAPALKIIGIYSLITIVLRVRMASERVFLDIFGGKELVGVYVLYFGLAIIIKTLVEAAFEIHYSPYIIENLQKKKYKEAHRIFKRLIAGSLGAAIVLGTILIYSLETLLLLLKKTDGPYVEHIAEFPFVIMAYVAVLISDLFALLLYGNNKDYSLLSTNIASLAAFFLVTFFLFKDQGMNAVSFGIMAYSFVQAVMIYIIHKNNMRAHWNSVAQT